MNMTERLPRFEQVMNYRDLVGEDPSLLAVRVTASAGLLWRGTLWFGCPDPKQSLSTVSLRPF